MDHTPHHAASADQPGDDLLTIRNLSKTFVRGRFPFQAEAAVEALKGINLSLRAGSSLALAGASGSGKSTLARCIARLLSPDSGEVRFQGVDLFALDSASLFAARRRLQLVFQQPSTSLNPSFSALDVVTEPLRIRRVGSPADRHNRAIEIMEKLGLPVSAAPRPALEFSGGQKQRLALARALVLDPSLLILDEAFSGLDLPLQAQLGELLLALCRERNIGLLLITHDLRLASHLTDQIAIIHKGIVIESGPTAKVLANPSHPDTRALLAAVPKLETCFRA